MVNKMRCFVAIDLPENLKKDIETFIINLKKSNLFYGKFVETENLHLSLKFLGDVEENKLDLVKKSLKYVNFDSFSCSIKGLNAFPNTSFVKVLWLGVDKGRASINKLHDQIENSISFPKDRFFTPHITLARIKNISDKRVLSKFFNMNENISFGESNVSSFCLFKSTLTSNGPIYEKIEKFNL